MRLVILLLVGLMALTAIAQAPLDRWMYKCRGTADADASEGAARILPVGDTNDGMNHLFDWNLYSLPRGDYRVTLRAKITRQPTRGALSMYADVIEYASGRNWQRPFVLRVAADEVQPGAYATYTGTFTNNTEWPYTYWFFRFINAFPQEAEVRLDTVTLELLTRKPDVPAAPALQRWFVKGRGIKDAQATEGEAGAPDDIKSSMELPLGKYEAIFRVKVLDTSGDSLQGINCALYFCIEGNGAGGGLRALLDAYYIPKPSSFRADRYEMLRFPFEVSYPATTAAVAVRVAGKLDPKIVRIDSVEIRLLERMSEAATADRMKISRETALRKHAGKRAWLAEGLFARETGVPQALNALGWEVADAWFSNYHENYALRGQIPGTTPPKHSNSARPSLDPDDEEPAPDARPENAPPDWVSDNFERDWMAYDVIVLQDIPGRLLSLQQRVAVYDFVQAGGGLLLIGGMYGLDRGGYGQSDLLNVILPVTLADASTLHALTPPTPVMVKGPLVSGVAFPASAVVCWLHDVTPKPGAIIQLTAGTRPLLVSWQVGKGRVAVLAAPPYGAPTAPAVGYWTTPAWQTCLTRVLRNLGG